MSHTIRAIAAALGAEAEGNLELTITGAAEPGTAGPADLALAMDPRYAAGIAKGRARAAIVWPGADWRAMGLEAAIFVPRSRMAMAGLTRLLAPEPAIAPGIHAMAIVDPAAEIGADVAIGPFTTIARGARIGRGTRISSHVAIGEGVCIGEDALLLEGVRIGPRVRIGARFIAHPGAVIGSDGFSFVTPDTSDVERVRTTLGHRGRVTSQGWKRIHSIGAVTIGDDVEVGANATIDRGTIRDTRVGARTKVDNLVHIGHNVEVGEDCLICGQVGIAGSARIGSRVVLAGQCGVSDNIFVGDDVICGGATKIFTNAPAGRVLLGSPAVRMETHVEMQKALRRLPRLLRRLAALD